jgi:hypothetical protein
MAVPTKAKIQETLTTQLNNPYLLSLLLSLPFILIFLLSIDHYEIETLQRKYVFKESELNFWADMNRDGICEQVQTFTNRNGKAAVTIRNRNDNALNQWNLDTRFHVQLYNRNVLISDIDGDSIPEISLITQDSGRVYLNIIKTDVTDRIWLEKIFVDTIRAVEWQKDYLSSFYPEAIYFGNKPFADIIFSIRAGFSRTPRKIYRYALNDSAVHSSQNLNSAGVNQVSLCNNSNGYEIIISNSSPANDSLVVKTFPNDNFTWLTILDRQLNLKFPPVLLGGKHSSAQTFKIQNTTFNGYVSMIRETMESKDKYRIVFFDEFRRNANTLDQKFNLNKYSGIFLHQREPMLITGNRIYSFKVPGHIEKMATLSYDHPVNFFGRSTNISLHEDYILAYTPLNSGLAIVQCNWKSIFNLDETVAMAHGFSFHQIENHDGNPQFAIQNGKDIKKFQITRPFIYLVRWPVGILIYLLMLSLVTFIRKLQQAQFKKRIDEERRVSVIKARSLKNLVNPHFTLNALDAISSLITRSSAEQAKQYINKFARLIHSLLSRSEDLFVPLGQELEFVKDYLDLQQLRFKDVFEYRIEIAEGVKQNRLIPKILIQTFAENAVRHGLRPKGKDGLLLIRINMEQKHLKITVEDNGIGRKAALEQDTTHTGTGLKVIYQLIDILKYHADEPVRFHTRDLFDENGQPAGTRVEVLLPEFRESVWEE